MKNTNVIESNFVTNEVGVNLYVFGVFVLNRIGRHVHCTDIIKVDKCCICSGTMKLN